VVRQNSPRAASARSNSYTTVTPVPSSSAVAAGLPGSAWSTIDFYSLIRARGQSLLAQNTVRVSTKSSEWVPTTITVQRGQMLWVDIKDDIGSSVRASDNAANIVPNQPGGALLARISEDGGMFVLEKASTPIFAPNNGQIFLLINHNTSEEQLVNVAKSVRLLVSH
jgi:hypothetical protein